MKQTIAFDVYGTLIDTHGVIATLNQLNVPNAQAFSAMWREKQLEYAFRRALMKNYVDFSVCTYQALQFTNQHYNAKLNGQQLQQLLDYYSQLPAFDDVKPALEKLHNEQHRLFAFSNGSSQAVEKLLNAANISHFFHDIISVEAVQSFKPDPNVYQYFLTHTKADIDNAWLISSNPFDIIGAINTGLNTAWVKRNKNQVFDPWQKVPNIEVSSLSALSFI